MLIANECMIIANSQIAKDTYKLVVAKPETIDVKCGQFAMLKIQNHFLQRPISIADADQTTMTFIYKVVGAGTSQLATMTTGTIAITFPLGNGFDLEPIKNEKSVSIFGGGIGIAPLYYLVKQIKANNPQIAINLYIGFRTAEEMYLVSEFEQLATVTVFTDDGSFGIKGHPLSIAHQQSYVYGCGPELMLNGLCQKFENGQISTEEYMACGIGICMGCVKKIDNQNKRVCVDGPVYPIKEFIC